ncbi:MAG: beta-lactamase family protein [Lachnospiraceae bacterium]|nr:beta-lactamase family protein [Lachnospiraceae bacterium]
MHEAIRETIEYLSKKVPYSGGAVYAFRDGKTVEKSCFGYQDIAAQKPVTEETLFQIASMSKSFCTVLISMLADEGLLDWDKPVKYYWPEYHSYDPYVTEHMTLTDLACHRSGVCSHNKQRFSMFDNGAMDLKNMAERTLDLAPCFGFRERFAYQNEMYGILGYLAERVTGKTYYELLQERIAKPVGMEIQYRAVIREDETRYAVGYELPNLRLTPVDPHKVAPCTVCAGGVVTNLNGIEKWIRFLAAGCVTEDGQRLLSKKAYEKLIHPILYWGQPQAPDRRKLYALGLAPSVYRGEKLVYHGGVLMGFRSAMGFFEEKNSGYVIMMNCASQPYSALKVVLCDIALDRVQENYHKECDETLSPFLAKKDFEALCLPKRDVTEEDRKQYRFDGTFTNPAYGDMTFSYEGEDRLRISYANDADEFALYRGNGIFQAASSPITDVRYAEDGNSLIFSKCEFYSPDVFTRKA